MLIISFDAVGDSELDELMSYPTIASFAKEAAIVREVSTIFASNTYPIHTSVVTGVKPAVHGICANIEPFPALFPQWKSAEKGIRAKTLWQAAKESGIDTATVFWPVTAGAKTIRYNIPEVLARPGESQIITSLKAGSKYLQLKYFLKYRPTINRTNLQPGLDNFATACMADIMRHERPGLCLIHLTAYDTMRHKYGKNSTAIRVALETLDHNLSLLLEAAGDRPVILFSDHSQLEVHK
ncbi:MAG: ectonucleotide pyrophosphatase/phosphodiesterase, partial [Lachnospiraceae bacterium]|nr:ectonucleotide pyrophosphatase/phosphodiesterase [Lachnospiraceae bacterium]